MTNEFRVWCKNKNEWEKNSMLLDEVGGLYQWIHVPNTQLVRVSTVTHIVEFYTGIKDMKGNKIFEGDKVRHGYSNKNGEFFEVNAVSYSTRDGAFMIGSQKRLTPNMVKRTSVEIIGNIHEGVR